VHREVSLGKFEINLLYNGMFFLIWFRKYKKYNNKKTMNTSVGAAGPL
jgi:hypothetical protein